MNVVHNAEAMLEEVESESLQHFLTAVRSEGSYPGKTGIPNLDAHFSEISTCPSHAPLSPGDVIEIQGPAASGKSHLLYHLLMTCIMPVEHFSINPGGWGKAAVLFDTDGTFSIERFRQLLVSRLSCLLQHKGHDQPLDALFQLALSPAEEVVSQCLASLHVFRPTSTQQLAASLLHLQDYHSTNPDLRTMEIGVLAVDSMSAFYWKDRFALEQRRGSGNTTGTSASYTAPLQHVLTSLYNYRVSHGSVIVLTNWGLNAASKPLSTGEPSSSVYKQHLRPFPSLFSNHHPPVTHFTSATQGTIGLPSSGGEHASLPGACETAYSDLEDSHQVDESFSLTHHITLQPLAINPFQRDCSLTEAKREDSLRSAAVEQGNIRGFVRTSSHKKTGEFIFSVGERDISFSVRHPHP